MLPKENKNIRSLEKLGEELKKWNSFNRGKKHENKRRSRNEWNDREFSRTKRSVDEKNYGQKNFFF